MAAGFGVAAETEIEMSKRTDDGQGDYDPYNPRQTESVTARKVENDKREREQWEEQQFLNGFRQIKEFKAEIAGTMGDCNAVYERLKKIGFTKADIKWAIELEEKDASEILATMQRRLRIAKMFGHGIARQVEMFDADRTPAEDRAYDEGLAAGKLRKEATNPYGADSPQGQAWQRGMNDGTAFINQDLADQFEELIKGSDEPFPVEEAA